MAIPQRDPIERSIKAYARKHGRYERVHSEIFNDREQARCRRVVELALSSVTSGRDVPRALDLGCGTGNLTRHFLELGAEVLAADVSPHFLRMVEQRFGGEPALQTIRINGRDLEQIDDASVDVAAAYSVLHHVPDYLAMVREMLRVLRPGGVLYVDHEANENFWHATDSLGDFREEVAEAKRRGLPGWDPEARRWQRFLLPSKWTAAFHREVAPRLPATWRRGPLLDPRHQAEGDIHVWADDHIEWPPILERLAAADAEILLKEDYLVFRRDYPPEIYDRYRDSATDMRVLVARKAA